MSNGWHMYSFNQERFNELFLSRSLDHLDKFKELLEDEEEEANELLALAQQVLEKGLSYSNLNESLAKLLDYLIILSLSEYPTDEFLKAEYLPIDTIGTNVIHAIYTAIENHQSSFNLEEVDLIKAFCLGRRYKHKDINTDCQYIFLSPAEVSGLVNSIKKLLELNSVEETELIISFVLEPLEDCSELGTPMFMNYG